MNLQVTVKLFRASPAGGEWVQWTFEREHSFADETKSAVSQLLICPECHRMWAKILLADEPLAWPRAAFCAMCNRADMMRPVPGTLLLEEGLAAIDESLLAALPQELLEREFKLHDKAIENGYLSDADTSYQALLNSLRQQYPTAWTSRNG